MILGIGTDIVAVARMAELRARHGARVATRLLAPVERGEPGLERDPARFLAKRFAAKEAFAKAVGTGMRAPVAFSAIGVGHDALGRPGFAFAPELAAWLDARGIGACHLSLSDEQEYVIAFVIVESR